MNTNMKRVISGLAALGIALSGMALGTSSAWAVDGETESISAGSTTIKETDQGTITISGGAVDHTFNGYKLGYLTSISYNQIEPASFASASMTGYTLATNPTYKDAIETALEKITDKTVTGADSGKTLKDRYLADKNYCGSECTPVAATGEPNDPNPLGWFFANYGGGYENEAKWGGSKTGDASDATDASILRQFATRVSAAIAAASTQEDTTLTSNVNGKSTEVPQGYYLLRDTTDLEETVTPSDTKKETQSAPILVSTTYKVTIGMTPVTFTKDASNPAHDLGKVDLKNSTPKVAKQVVTDENGTAQTQPDYAIGDTVTYELKSTLPYYTGYSIDKTYGRDNDADSAKARTYKIIDTASAGLTVDLNKTGSTTPAVVSVKVTPDNGDNAVTLTEGKDFDVENGTAPTADPYNGGSTTIIDLGKYVNMVAGSQSETNGVLENGTVTVIFQATLNKNAKISDPGKLQGNPNKVELQYSNNPENMDSKHTTPGDTVNVYTYQFQLKKTDKGGTALQNAEFTVKVTGGIGTNDNAHVNKYLAKDNSGEWTYAGSEDAAYKFTSGEGGIVSGLTGLDSGTYEVHETKAPEGYTQAFLPKFSVTITPTAKAGTETAFGGTGTYTIDQVAFSAKTTVNNGYVTDASQVNGTGIFQYTIYNAKNLTELPMTGGAGLVAIIAVGVLLAGAGTAAAVRSRKSTSRAVRV